MPAMHAPVDLVCVSPFSRASLRDIFRFIYRGYVYLEITAGLLGDFSEYATIDRSIINVGNNNVSRMSKPWYCTA